MIQWIRTSRLSIKELSLCARRYGGALPTGLMQLLLSRKSGSMRRSDFTCVTLGPGGEWFLRAENGRSSLLLSSLELSDTKVYDGRSKFPVPLPSEEGTP